MPSKDKYTDPKLRDEIKEEIKESDKGGAPGQWSARKAQMMAQEYKRRGGDYTTDKSEKDEDQKNLSKWTDEEWQTKEGSGNAKQVDGSEKRYLPKKAWEKMSEKEKEDTEKKKLNASKKGQQYVDNTDKAKESRKQASKSTNGNAKKDEKQTNKSTNGNSKTQNVKQAKKSANSKARKGEDDNHGDEDEESAESDSSNKDVEEVDDDDEDEEEYEDSEGSEDGSDEADSTRNDDEGQSQEEEDNIDDDDDHKEEDSTDEKPGQKRKTKSNPNGSSKKQKSSSSNSKSGGNAPKGKIGSKHMPDDEPGKPGSADRLPKKGQKITWRAMPGYVEGKVVEVLEKGKTVDGKSVKASESDPKIVMTSDKSGKICVHKPDACYYD